VIGRSAILVVLIMGSILFAQSQAPASPVPASPGTPATLGVEAGLKTYTVPAGTRILLSLKSEISTRVAMPGDPVYLMSEFPVVEDGAVVLPAGMYVKGFIDNVQRPGKIKGRAQLQMHFATMIFPNGAQIAIPGSVDNVPGSSEARVKGAEGTIQQSGSNGRDVERAASNTAEGAGVGSLVGYGTGNAVKGLGIGAGAGATLGVLTTLLTRGNDIVFTPGTQLEMVLSRPVAVQQTQLAGMPTYTGVAMPSVPSAAQSPSTGPQPNK